MSVDDKRVECSNQCAVCYEFGEIEEGCESNRMHIERGVMCAALKMRSSVPDSMEHDGQ